MVQIISSRKEVLGYNLRSLWKRFFRFHFEFNPEPRKITDRNSLNSFWIGGAGTSDADSDSPWKLLVVFSNRRLQTGRRKV